MSGKKAAGSTKIIAIAVITFVLGLVLGIAASPSPSPGSPVTITKQETVTATYVSYVTETVTKTVTAPPPPPPRREDQFLLKVLEVVVDRVSEATHDYYIFEIEATYKGGRSWTLFPLSFEVLSDKGYKYSTTFSLAVKQYLPSVELKDGESAKGQLAFKLPKGERPVKLVYEDKLNAISLQITDLPAPSREATFAYTVVVDVKSEHSFIFASGSRLTPSSVYYSGETIEVELKVKYSKFIGEPDAITITLITVEAFELVEIEPKLPLEVRDGEEVVLKLLLKAPASGFSGNIKVTVHA